MLLQPLHLSSYLRHDEQLVFEVEVRKNAGSQIKQTVLDEQSEQLVMYALQQVAIFGVQAEHLLKVAR